MDMNKVKSVKHMHVGYFDIILKVLLFYSDVCIVRAVFPLEALQVSEVFFFFFAFLFLKRIYGEYWLSELW